jgi:riboflavin synthase
MFTGIIEALGRVVDIQPDNENIVFKVQAPFTHELKVDQSVAHNGVCLTITAIEGDTYSVTAISETLQKTNISALKINDVVNLERCMKADGRFDGHVVQGHVDQVGVCDKVIEDGGSWRFYFSYDQAKGNITVEKGSVCVNGISLTVVDSEEGKFSVAVIPYTFEHTNLKTLTPGDHINIEFDILGKYISKLLKKNL